MEVLVNIMDFGGYVAYTVGGFKCHAFGTQSVKDAINSVAFELDIPQSLSLRPGRNGFRRTVLRSSAGKVIVYTALVGLSEPKVSRTGSFLAIGLAAYEDIDCTANNVGYLLCSLLADLIKRVSDGNRFTSELSIDVFNAFLRDNSRILEELHKGFVPFSRAIGSRAEQDVVFLSEDRISLSTVFNRVCNCMPSATNFFLFDAAASAELQSARHDFRIAAWPIRAAQADVRAPQEIIKPQLRQSLNESNLQTEGIDNQSDAERWKELFRIIDKSDAHNQQRFSSIEDSISLWRLIGLSANGVLVFVLIVVLYVSYSWHSTTQERIAAIQKQLTDVKEYPPYVSQPLQEPNSRLEGQLTAVNPSPTTDNASSGASTDPTLRIVEVLQDSNWKEIRTAHCPGSAENVEFEKKLTELNKASLNDKGLFKKKNKIKLPDVCKP